MNILVTGATGNVGRAVLDSLGQSGVNLYAGVRNITKAKTQLSGAIQFCTIDFEQEIFSAQRFDAVFLLRPPDLANASLFKTCLEAIKTKKVVFLSVQGADKKAYLPHAKIEKVIVELGLPHVFLRPSYFMENLTTTLWPELQKNKRIYLPSGNARFNWIAISDIADVAAVALTQDIQDSALELCNCNLNFHEIVAKINTLCGTKLTYDAPALLPYIAYSLRQEQGLAYTLVMLMLHYLPKFTAEPECSSDVRRITGKPPMSIEAFILEKRTVFEQLAT